MSQSKSDIMPDYRCEKCGKMPEHHNGEDLRTILKLHKEAAHRDQQAKELELAWQNVSMLAFRMSKKKTIEGMKELFESGKHLIYSNIFRGKFERGES